MSEQYRLAELIHARFPNAGPELIVWPSREGVAVKRADSDWEWLSNAELTAIATKRPTTDEQGPGGTSGHRHDGEAHKATGGDE